MTVKRGRPILKNGEKGIIKNEGRKVSCWECGEKHAPKYFKWLNGLKYCADCFEEARKEE